MENKRKFRPDPDLKLMDQIRQVLRYHHYAYRTTRFPKSIQPDMRHHLEKVKRSHDEDLAQDYGGVYLPEALTLSPHIELWSSRF